MTKRVVTVDDNTESYLDCWYCDFYTCSHCGEGKIAEGFKYCPSCGYKLEWCLSDGGEYEP